MSEVTSASRQLPATIGKRDYRELRQEPFHGRELRTPIDHQRDRCLSPIAAFLLALFVCCDLSAADSDRRSGFQPQSFAIVGAKLVVAPGKSIENGNLIIRNGLIVEAGKGTKVPSDALVIDGKNLIVYPGFLDAATSELLDAAKKPNPPAGRSVDFGRYVLAATRPDNRNSMTPDYHGFENLKLDANVLDGMRKSGFTAVHVLPAGRVASGQGTLITTGGAPQRETVLLTTTYCEFQLFAPGGGNYPQTLMGATAHLRQAFLDARHYHTHSALYGDRAANVQRPPIDATLEALDAVVLGNCRAVFLANSRDDIHRALNFAGEQHIKPLVWGGRDAHRCIDRLKHDGVELMLQVDFGNEPKIERSKPSDKLNADVKAPLRVQQDRVDSWTERVAGLSKLHAAGVRFAISSQPSKNRADVLKSLRKAVEHGLPESAALAALTLDAAKLLGIDSRLGTLERGKLAHVVIMTGPFLHEQSKVRYVLVDGQKFEYNAGAKPVDLKPKAGSKTADLSGKWQLDIKAADGKVAATVELTQAGSKLGGTFTSGQGDGKLASGSVKDAAFDFVVAIGAGARTVELKFNGKLANEKLEGTLKSAFGAATSWSASRLTPAPDAKPKNPVQLSLPETDDESKTAKSKSKPSITDLPSELESDRLQRPIKTGGNVLIKNATVLTGTGQTLPNTSILVKDGKIAAIGRKLKAEKKVTVIDAAGRFVMPGIIDTHSHIMITAGINEATQSIVPEVRVKDVVNTSDTSEYRALAGGVTTARLLHGSANVIGGQDAVVKLKYGATAAEHILDDSPQGVKFALGENVKFRTNRFPNTRMGVEATLNRAFQEAVDYRRRWMQHDRAVAKSKDKSAKLLPPRRDLRLEALADIVNHEKFIHSHCYRADEILMLMRVASNLGIRVWSLQHVLEGYKIAPEIVAHGASCSTFADWWAYKVEAYDATPYNAALLKEAGANIVIKSDDWELIRHLYLEAAKTVRYGNMHPDHALQTITLNAARELGIDKRMGSIEVGKDADLAIYSGHPFNAFGRCEQTLIDGEVYFTRSKQPSAMSPQAAKNSSQPTALSFPSEAIRQRKLDLTPSDSRRYAIVGATLHPVDADVIDGGTLLIHGDKITAIGKKVSLPSGTRILDGTDLHVYPGFIDAGTTLGLVEIGKVKETHDYAEGGQLQPDLRAGVAINPDSELIPVARAGGITNILIRPTGGLISGQASLAKLGGWTAPEMVLDYEFGLQINWPKGDSKKAAGQLKEFLEQARFYDKLQSNAEKKKGEPPISDPRLEAIRPYLNGKKRVFIEANSRKQIAEALLFAEAEKLNCVITGGSDAWKLASELKKRNVRVIVGPVMRKPIESHDPFDAPYANPGRLYEAGVKFCIRSNSASNSRNAPFEAAMAVAYGLPEKEGLKAVTLSAAEILDLDDRLGSLTVGKTASLIIADGSPLQHTTQIKGVFVAGAPFAPESRQTRFYERYRRRLHEVQKSQPQITPAAEGP